MCEAITALYAVCKTIQTPFNATHNFVLRKQNIEVFNSYMCMYICTYVHMYDTYVYDERVIAKIEICTMLS